MSTYTSTSTNRYSDNELNEFRTLINTRLTEAQTDYELLKETLNRGGDHGTEDTSPSNKITEESSDSLSREEAAQLAARRLKYIDQLKNALVRIENKTYGICRVTGQL